MQRAMRPLVACVCWLALTGLAGAQNPHLVVYEGTAGPGRGKHVVFLAGDHEYRSEETLPALARILARHYGFKCSVFITTDPKTGFIEPGSSHISGLDALADRGSDGRVPALPGFPRRSDAATSSTTSIAAVRWSASAPRPTRSRSSVRMRRT